MCETAQCLCDGVFIRSLQTTDACWHSHVDIQRFIFWYDLCVIFMKCLVLLQVFVGSKDFLLLGFVWSCKDLTYFIVL